MEEFNYKITAGTLKEFKEIEEKLLSLSDAVKRGLSNVSKGLVGIHCKIKDDFKKPQNIILPDTVTHMKRMSDTELSAYADDFYFEIKEEYPGETTKHYNYHFVPMGPIVTDAVDENSYLDLPKNIINLGNPTVALHKNNKIVFHHRSNQKELLKYVKEMLPSWKIIKKFNFK